MSFMWSAGSSIWNGSSASPRRRGEPSRTSAPRSYATRLHAGEVRRLVEFPTEPFAQYEILRSGGGTALGSRGPGFDADLELGRHGDIVAELETLVDRCRSASDSGPS